MSIRRLSMAMTIAKCHFGRISYATTFLFDLTIELRNNPSPSRDITMVNHARPLRECNRYPDKALRSK